MFFDVDVYRRRLDCRVVVKRGYCSTPTALTGEFQKRKCVLSSVKRPMLIAEVGTDRSAHHFFYYTVLRLRESEYQQDVTCWYSFSVTESFTLQMVPYRVAEYLTDPRDQHDMALVGRAFNRPKRPTRHGTC